jgi:hypothetical protein
MSTRTKGAFTVVRSGMLKVVSAALLTIGTLFAAFGPSAALASRGLSAGSGAAQSAGVPAALSGSAAPGAIAGQIENAMPAASGASSTCVTAFRLPSAPSTSGARFAARTNVTPEGRFLLSGLAPGGYGVRFGLCQAPAGFAAVRGLGSLGDSASEWYGGDGSGDGYSGALTLSASIRVPVVSRMVTPLRPLVLPRVEQDAGLTGDARLAAVLGRPMSTPSTATGSTGSSTGGIAGTVTDSNGKPLAGICVEAFPWRGGFGASGTTSKDGRYAITGLAPETWAVGFAPGCGNRKNYLMQWYGGSEFPPGKPVKVVTGKTTKGIDAALALGGGLRATVTSAGKNVSGLCATAVTETPTFESFVGGVVVDGHFTFSSLIPGPYRLEFGGQCARRVNGNYSPQWYDNEPTEAKATVVSVVAGPDTSVAAVLAPGGEITGTVVSDSGSPLGGICVSTSSGLANLYGWEADTVTSRSGTFVLSGLATGSYALDYSPGCGSKGSWVPGVSQTRVAVTAGQTISGVTLTVAPGGTIAGVVTDARGPVTGVCVVVNGDFMEEESPALTGNHGSYHVSDLAPGPVLVEFVPACEGPGSMPNLVPQWFKDQGSEQTADPVTVKAGKDTSGISAVLQPGGTLSGVVTDTAGRPVAGVCPVALPSNGAGSSETGSNGFQTDVTNAHGSYSLTALPTGTYTLYFMADCSALAQRFVSETYGGGSGSGAAFFGSPVVLSVIAGSRTAGIDISLPFAGSVSGTVLDAFGNAPSFMCVMIGAPDGRFLAEDFGATGPDGQYLLTGALPGSYTIGFSTCGEGPYAPQWYKGSPTQGKATVVTITAGKTLKRINAILPVGGDITGKVGVGRPLRNLCVEASSSLETGSLGFVAKSGDYLVGGLSTGSYTVVFNACSGAGDDYVTATDPSRVHVTVGQVTSGINWTLRLGGSISGEVTAAGAPAAGVCVTAITPSGYVAGNVTVTRSRGLYTIQGLPTGNYDLEFRPNCGAAAGLAPEWSGESATRAGATAVHVVARRTTAGVDVALRADGSITGSVTSSSGSGLTGICVTAVSPSSGVSETLETLTSTTGGSYDLGGLPAGGYKIEFTSACGSPSSYTTQWFRDATSKKSATTVVVAAGAATSGIDAQLAA